MKETFSAVLDVDKLPDLVRQVTARAGDDALARALQQMVDLIEQSPEITEGTVVLPQGAQQGGPEAFIGYRIDDDDSVQLWIFNDERRGKLFEAAWQELEDDAPSIDPAAMQQRKAEAAERERVRLAFVARIAQDSAEFVRELAAMGVQDPYGGPLTSLSQVDTRQYPQAIPVLLSWVPRTPNVGVKMTMLRAMSKSGKKDEAVARALFKELRNLPEDDRTHRETIASLTSIVADDRVYEGVAELARDPSTVGRWGYLLALGNMKRRRAEATTVLREALEDAAVAVHAAESLARLGAVEALPRMRELANPADPWARRKMRQAINKLDRLASRKPGALLQSEFQENQEYFKVGESRVPD